jgi:uncharacterized membrane protein
LVEHRMGRRSTNELMISVDLERVLATAHVLAAFSAVGGGAAVLLMRKGTNTHRVIGAVYVLALLLLNVAALSLRLGPSARR